MNGLAVASSDVEDSKPHDKYWFDDGSLLLRVQNVIYKVHRTLLYRQSTVLSSLPVATDNNTVNGGNELTIIQPPEGVTNVDLEALLEHLYHDIPLDDTASFPRVASLLRVSSQQQLGFPKVHVLAKSTLAQLLHSSPHTFIRPDHAEAALALAIQYDVPSIRKQLYYSVATHPHHAESECPSQAADDESEATSAASQFQFHFTQSLAPEVVAACDALLEQLIERFTPVLFTIAGAGHMECSNVFAEKWMPLVIQPALLDNGLSRPLETLEQIIAIDWAAEGICAQCVREKTDEWRSEQRDVWVWMDEWLKTNA